MNKFNIDIKSIKFDEKGLVPVVIQDELTEKVLFLSYMDMKTVEKTIESGMAYFYTDYKKEEHGLENYTKQEIVNIAKERDGSSLLIKIIPDNKISLDNYSFVNNSIKGNEKQNRNKASILQEIYDVIMERKRNNPEDSYVAKKMREGIDRILKKIGEEAGEVIIAAKNGNAEEIGWEMADLIFHLWMVLGYYNLTPDIIYDKLIERRK